MDIQELKKLRPHYEGLDDAQIVDLVQRSNYPDASREDVARALGVDLSAKAAPEKMPERSMFGYVNDQMINAGNAAAGTVKSAVDLVAPDSGASQAIGEFIQSGKDKQSDKQKFLDRQLEQKLRNAEGGWDKAGAYLKHAVLEDPSGTVAQAVGNLGPFGVAGRGAAAVGMGTGARTATMMGLAGASGAGEVRGNIWQQVNALSDADLMAQSPEYLDLRVGGMSEQDAKARIGADLERNLPEVAAVGVLSALGGKVGLEGMAGRVASRMGRLAATGVGALDEGLQGAAEQVATNVGLQRALPDQSLTEDVALNAVTEGLAGGVGGAVLGGHRAPDGPLTRAAKAAGPMLALPAPTVTVTPGGTAVTSDQRGELIRQRQEAGAGGIYDRTPVPEEPAEAPFVAQGPQEQIDASMRNLEMWGKRAKPYPLEGAQARKAALAERGVGVEVVPHPRGDGFTVIPSEWLAAFMRNQVPQAEGAGMLPAPDRAAPDAPLVDDQGQLRPQTYGEQADARAAVVDDQAEAERKASLGLTPDVEAAQAARANPVVEPEEIAPAPTVPQIPMDNSPTGTLLAGEGGVRAETKTDVLRRQDAVRAQQTEVDRKAAVGLTPDVEKAQAARLASMQPGDIKAPSGNPFKNEQAAKRAQKKAAGSEVVPVDGGWVVRPAAQDVEVRDGTSSEPTAAVDGGGDGRGIDVAAGLDGAQRNDAVRAAGPDDGDGSGAGVQLRGRAGEPDALAPVDDAGGNGQRLSAVAGDKIDDEWTAFKPESGTLAIPRAEMPQVKAEHRGAMTNFLNARGIEHESDEVPAGSLKPTQAEFAPAKVDKARDFTGGDRSILVSEDGHVADGHHQWLSKLEKDEPVKVIRLKAPIKDLLEQMKAFPSSDVSEGATPGSSAPVPDGQQQEQPAQAAGAGAGAAPAASIQDVGEKIGGARKDTAASTGRRGPAAKRDDRPGWMKRYESMQSVKEAGQGKAVWHLLDSKTGRPVRGPNYVAMSFDSQEAAEAAIPLVEVARNHRVSMEGEGQFVIKRDVSDRKRVQVVKQVFTDRDQAMQYLREHAVEIIETKTSFGEEILSKPERVVREGSERRTGDIKAENFIEDFGLRGVEFGNWNNQDERQEVMNHAFDALHDLAEVMGVPPKALGLGGQLGLAFGARGHGLSGARAHYEVDYGVINLTKMSGAGSLAHEWFHALDHYLARQDGKASRTREENERGDKAFKRKGVTNDMATHGFKASGSEVRPEVRAAYENAIQVMFLKGETYVEDLTKVEKFIGVTKSELAKQLQNIRDNLARELDKSYYKRNFKPATAAQLAEFDGIAERMIAGEAVETEWRTIPSSKAMPGVRWTNDALERLSVIIKAVRGRSGFTAQRDGTLDSLRGYMTRYSQRLKMLAEAQQGSEKTRMVPTDYLMGAKSVDQGRASDYWTTPHEMAARAFESFVQDQVEAKGGTSDFLVYGTHGAVPTPWGWGQVYPEGSERTAINKAFSDFLSTLQTKEDDSGNVVLFSRRSGSGNQLPDAIIGRRLGDLNNHPQYAAAKGGDEVAGLRVAQDLVSDDLVAKVKAMAGEGAIFVPVLSVEATGHNKIPQGVAEVLASRAGGETTDAIVQANSPKRTAMDGLDRVLTQPVFEGEVMKGGRYVLVDDALTQGGTFAALASHIKDNGGEVVAAVALTGKQYSAKLAPSSENLQTVRDRYADLEPQFQAATGYGFDALTESEARYLAKHGDADAVRDRISAEGQRAVEQGDEGPAGSEGEVTPFRRSAAARESDAVVFAIREQVKKFTSAWKNAPEVVVLASFEDAPESAKRANRALIEAGATTSPDAFMTGGKVYLLAGRVHDQADVHRLVSHEVLGHQGLRGHFGDSLNDILDQMWSARRREVKSKAEQYGLDVSTVAGRRQAAEEVLAEWAESQPKLGFVQRAVAAVRAWLRKHFPAMRLTDNDIIAQYLMPARGFIERGRAEGMGDLAPAFSRAQGDDVMFARSAVGAQARQAVHDFVNSAGAQVSWLDRTVKTQYAKAQKFPGYRKVFDRLQGFIEGTSALANQAADQAPDILPRLDSIKDLKRGGWESLVRHGLSQQDAKAVAAPVFEGTLSWTRKNGKLVEATDIGTAGVVWTDAELRERFKLTDAQVSAYRQFRAAVDASLDQVAAGDVVRLLGDRATPEMATLVETAGGRRQIREAAEAVDGELGDLLAEKFARVDDLKRRGYAPLSRFGRFFVHAVNKEGETVFFGLEESRSSANRLAREMRAELGDGANVEQGLMSQEAHKLYAAMPIDSLELFADAVGAEESELFQQYLRLAKNNRSTMKRLIARKGTAGFSGDVPRVLASFITSNARAVSSGLHVHQAKKLAAEIQQGDVKDEAVKLIEAVTEPEESGAAIRGLMFTNFIGGSIASAVVNLTQPVMMTLPYLSQWGGMAKAGTRLVAAAKAGAGGEIADKELRDALVQAEHEGIVAPQEIHHLLRQASSGLRQVPVAGAALHKLAFLWGTPFAMAEAFNRRVSFVAAYQTAKAEKIADPYGFATKAVIETQGLYNAGNKPNWARGPVGATAMTFKQFSIHYLEWLGRMNKSGPQGRRAALWALALLVLAAGADGLPFISDVDDLVDTVGQAMGYDLNSRRARREFAAEILGEEMGGMATRGFSAMGGFPVDVSVRMGMGNLLPATDLLLKSNSDPGRSVAEVAGVGGSLFIQYRDALAKLLSGEPVGALVKAAPNALQNLAKSLEMASTGEYRDGKDRKVQDVTLGQAGMKALSFQPAEVAKESAMMAEGRRSEQLAKTVESEIADAWARAVVDRDPERVAEAKARLQDWNEKNPTMPIKIEQAQIRRRAKAMRQSRADRYTKTVAPERRKAAEAELAA